MANALLSSGAGSVLRNNTGDWLGFAFTVPVGGLIVTSLGRWVISGNTQTHAVNLVDNFGTIVATANIATSGEPDGYKYASITPVILAAGGVYYLASQEFNGGDQFYDFFASTLSVGSTLGACFGGPTSFSTYVGNNYAYGPVNLLYVPLVPGTLAISSVTSTTVNLSVTAASGTTGPYTNQWHVGTTSGFVASGATAIPGATGSTLAYVPGDNGLRFYRVAQTDSAGTPETTYTGQAAVSCPLPTLPALSGNGYAGTIKIVAIGDSILRQTPSGGSQTPVQNLVTTLAANMPGASISSINRALDGTATADWLTGGTNLTAAIAAAVTAGSTDALILLGINDAKAAAIVPSATYTANLTNIANGLIAGIATLKRVWIVDPHYAQPGIYSGLWTEQSDDLPRQYALATPAILGGKVIANAVNSYSYWANYFATQTTDGTHPNAANGVPAWGTNMAAPMLSYFNPLKPAGKITGGALDFGRIGLTTGGRL